MEGPIVEVLCRVGFSVGRKSGHILDVNSASTEGNCSVSSSCEGHPAKHA